MATLTPKLALKKPVPNIETDWGLRLNETIDILDGSTLTANITGLGNVTYTDSGGGTVTISGKLLIGKGSITLIPEGTALVISGTGGSHGSLSGLLNDDHPQYANLSQNETVSGTWNFIGIPTISGMPVATGIGSFFHSTLLGLLNDNHPQYVLADGTRAITGNLTIASGIAASSGTITNTLTVGSGVVNITPQGVTVSGLRVATLNDILTISGSGSQAFRTINAVGSGTQNIFASDYLVIVTGTATHLELTLPSLSVVLGQSFRVQRDLDDTFSPNLINVDIETQLGELKNGFNVLAGNLDPYRITTGQGMTFMAVGGGMGWIALTDAA